MNSDQNNRTNRDQEEIANRKSGISPTTQAATERAAAKSPGGSGNVSPQSHRDYDEAHRRNVLARSKSGEALPDNQEGIGP